MYSYFISWDVTPRENKVDAGLTMTAESANESFNSMIRHKFKESKFPDDIESCAIITITASIAMTLRSFSPAKWKTSKSLALMAYLIALSGDTQAILKGLAVTPVYDETFLYHWQGNEAICSECGAILIEGTCENASCEDDDESKAEFCKYHSVKSLLSS